MLTSDVSLTYDPAYFAIVKRFANDSKAFDDAFSRAWYVVSLSLSLSLSISLFALN